MADRGNATIMASLLSDNSPRFRTERLSSTASALFSREDVMHTDENSLPYFGGIQVTLADAECAHILLELAKSPSPPADVQSFVDFRKKRRTWSESNTQNNSLLKRQLESSSQQAGRSTSSTRLTPKEEAYQKELIKRIRLDHNYFWSSEHVDREQEAPEALHLERTDRARRHSESDVPYKYSENDVPLSQISEPTDTHAIKPEQKAEQYDENTVPEEERVDIDQGDKSEQTDDKKNQCEFPYKGKTFGEMTAQLIAKGFQEDKKSPNNDSCYNSEGSDYKNKHTATVKTLPGVGNVLSILPDSESASDAEELLKDKPVPADDQNNQDSGNTDTEVDQGKDTQETPKGEVSGRFSNSLEMLVNCLEASEPNESKHLSNPNSPPDCEENEEGEIASKEGGENSLVVDHSSSPESEYNCFCCTKAFSKKRYLTKHMRRMHPETAINDTIDACYAVNCPQCNRTLSKKNFKRHSVVCNAHMKKSKKQLEMDLANCQFCGIRMRRHMLVRHLAQEHCVDPTRDPDDSDCDMDDYMYNSSSSSNSDGASELERGKLAEPKTTVMCQICNVSIHRSQLRQHFAKHIIRMSPSKSVVCQICGLQMQNSQLMIHLAEDHSLDENDEHPGVSYQVICQFCGWEMPSLQYEDHLADKHPGKSPTGLYPSYSAGSSTVSQTKDTLDDVKSLDSSQGQSTSIVKVKRDTEAGIFWGSNGPNGDESSSDEGELICDDSEMNLNVNQEDEVAIKSAADSSPKDKVSVEAVNQDWALSMSNVCDADMGDEGVLPSVAMQSGSPPPLSSSPPEVAEPCRDLLLEAMAASELDLDLNPSPLPAKEYASNPATQVIQNP